MSQKKHTGSLDWTQVSNKQLWSLQISKKPLKCLERQVLGLHPTPPWTPLRLDPYSYTSTPSSP